MPEYGFFPSIVFPYKDKIVDSILIRENICRQKPVLWHLLCNDTAAPNDAISTNSLGWKNFKNKGEYPSMSSTNFGSRLINKLHKLINTTE